jgi:DNA polymerase-3 subunit epsilon
VLALLDRNQVAHALDMLQHQIGHVDRPQARFVAAAANGALLRVQVAPFLGPEQRLAGMVFTLDDVGQLMGRESQRLRLLQSLATGVRAPVAHLRAATENLASFPDMPADRREQFVDIAAAEARVLTERLNTALLAYADALKGSLTLEDMRAADLLAVVQRRVAEALHMPVAIEEADADLWLRVDSYALAHAMTFLAARLAGDYDLHGFRLRAGGGGSLGEVDLIWTGAIVGSDALSLWEGEPMRVGLNGRLDAFGRAFALDRLEATAWGEALRMLAPALGRRGPGHRDGGCAPGRGPRERRRGARRSRPADERASPRSHDPRP